MARKKQNTDTTLIIAALAAGAAYLLLRDRFNDKPGVLAGATLGAAAVVPVMIASASGCAPCAAAMAAAGLV